MSASDEGKVDLERLVNTADKKNASVQVSEIDSSSNAGLEGLGFMAQENEELVDLDALFDALNLVAKENADSLNFTTDADHDGGILTVTNEAMASVGVSSVLEDLNTVPNEGLQDGVVSDES